jgi:hypothetical protein
VKIGAIDEQKTTPHALSGPLGPCVTLTAVKGEKTLAELVQKHHVYNTRRLHSSLIAQTPDAIYFQMLP